MDRANYLEEIRETMALAREYIASYRYFKERVKSVPKNQQRYILEIMDETYNAWHEQLKKYADLTQEHCREMDGTAFPIIEHKPA